MNEPTPPPPPDDMTVEEVWLKTPAMGRRAMHALLNDGRRYARDVRAMTDADLYGIPGMGPTGVRQVRKAFGPGPDAAEKAAAALASLDWQVDRIMVKLGAMVDAYRASRGGG